MSPESQAQIRADRVVTAGLAQPENLRGPDHQLISGSLDHCRRDETQHSIQFALRWHYQDLPSTGKATLEGYCRLPGLPGGRNQFKPIARMDVKTNTSNDGHCYLVAAIACA